MFKYRLPGLLTAFLLLAGAAGARGETNVYLRLRGQAAYRIRIAVAPFASGPARPAGKVKKGKLERVLENDLRFTTLFAPLSNRRFVAQTAAQDLREGRINFQEWRALGADLLIEGETRQAEGLLIFEGRVFDVRSGRTILHKAYDCPPSEGRYLMHRFADDIMLELTGARGVAQTEIAFLNASRNGKKELMLMDYDGHNLRQVTHENSIVLTPAWSPDGRRIAFTSYAAGNPDLYSVTLATGRRIFLSDRPGLNTAPAWSPDGKHLALVLSRRGNSEIYLADAHGGNLKPLTSTRGINTSPNWSPDGKKIVFTSDREGTPQIYVMDASGAHVRRLSHGTGYADQAVWSPRGDRIAFSAREGGVFQIIVLDLATGEQIPITPDAGNNEHPSWSPDGRDIVFSSTRAGGSDIYEMHLDGSGVRRLTHTRKAISPAWSPQTSVPQPTAKNIADKSIDRKGGITPGP